MQRLLLVALAAMLVQQDVPRSVDIWSSDPIAIDIDWITIDATGKETVTASRKTVAGPPSPLEFLHGPNRFVRFSYPGASPRTYSTAELLTAKKLHVPDVLPGGELLLIVPQATVRPERIRIEGPRQTTPAVSASGHASLAGLPAGEYRLTRIYEGGVAGGSQRVTVAAAKTALAVLTAEGVGAVRVSAPDHVCGNATDMGIDSLVYADVGVKFRTPPNRRTVAASKEPRCVMTFGGLTPGTFEAYYRSGRMPLGAGEFIVTPQAITAVDVTGHTVFVEGRLTMNGKPMLDASVAFRLTGKDSTGAGIQGEAPADASGYYRMALEHPGEYTVLLRARHLHRMESKHARLVEGRNFHDFAVTGGTITIVLTGLDPRSPVSIRMEGRAEGRQQNSTSGATYATAPKEPIVYQGMQFGEYKIAVTAGTQRLSRDMSNAKTVVLSAAAPEATVTFDLARR